MGNIVSQYDGVYEYSSGKDIIRSVLPLFAFSFTAFLFYLSDGMLVSLLHRVTPSI